jgi:hypothetical protein
MKRKGRNESLDTTWSRTLPGHLPSIVRQFALRSAVVQSRRVNRYFRPQAGIGRKTLRAVNGWFQSTADMIRHRGHCDVISKSVIERSVTAVDKKCRLNVGCLMD